MTILRSITAVVLILAAASAQAATVISVVDVPTRGVTQRILYLRPDAPVANIVMWPGGEAVLGIENDGTMSGLLAKCNPAVRNRQALADHGYAVAVLDAPSDSLFFAPPDMAAVMRYLRTRDALPTWVIGGSTSAAGTVDLLADPPPEIPTGAVFYNPEGSSAAQAMRIRVPSVVIYHASDPRQRASALLAALTAAPVVQPVVLTGGNDSGCSGYHTLNGLNGPFVDAITTFIDKYNATLVAAPPTVAVAVEFYNASLDHYFLSHIANEIALLDAGVAIKGWVRTGQSFNVYPAARADSSPVCRFYIPPGKGDSHFYGRGTVECTATGAANPTFVNEEPQFFHVVLPVAGVCPAGTRNIYRVFSNRADANHRYMVDRAIRDSMAGKGWLAEGDGPDLVVMCSPV